MSGWVGARVGGWKYGRACGRAGGRVGGWPVWIHMRRHNIVLSVGWVGLVRARVYEWMNGRVGMWANGWVWILYRQYILWATGWEVYEAIDHYDTHGTQMSHFFLRTESYTTGEYKQQYLVLTNRSGAGGWVGRINCRDRYAPKHTYIYVCMTHSRRTNRRTNILIEQ